MNRYDHLLQKIANELRIFKGLGEEEISYECRIVYSVMGRMATASLWDTLEDGEQVSIIHFKKRIDQIAYGYMELYPELKAQFQRENLQEIKNEIYDIYLKSGYFYHAPNRIAAAAPCAAAAGEVYFTRGMPLGQEQFLSGLGTYQLDQNGLERRVATESMFQLNQTDIREPWREVTREIRWTPFRIDPNVEFLNLNPPFRSYWVRKPDKGIVSLCRVLTLGAPVYYLYQVNEKQAYFSPIPEWLIMDPVTTGTERHTNYRLLSNSLLANLGVLPPTRFHINGETVSIHLGYRMPPMEMNFVKLYSWPMSFYTPKSPFKRVSDRSVFMSVKKTLEKTGYQFIEE